MKVAIIGGGASGLFVAGKLSNSEIDTTIFDGNEKLGKKLYITGKGRCNVTNLSDKDNFLNNVVHGQKFMISSISNFNSKDTINFFENLGCKLKVERGNRVFPVSDKASDVIKALEKNINKKYCKINLNEKVVKVENIVDCFKIITTKSQYKFDKVIIATGGKSYPATGSDGDGYKFAKQLGINVLQPIPALVPIKIKDEFCKSLQGLSLKNVELKAKINGKDKAFFGEMLFANDAITGPIALSLSSYIGKETDVKLSIDFKPALDYEKLEKRLLRDFQENLNKEITYIIKGLLPKKLIPILLEKCNIDNHKKVNSITVEERHRIINNIKNFKLDFDKLYPIESGIITSGGIDLKEINPKTMESKKVKGLYFIGEVLDVDCLTGGYNLQSAFVTANSCAKSIIEDFIKIQ